VKTITSKREYSEAQIASILKKVKPEPVSDIDFDLRLKKLENSIDVIFAAIAQLKSAIDALSIQIPRSEVSLKPEKIHVEKFLIISRKKAASMIREYILKHPGCRTSEIIADLRLQPDLVLQILKKLSRDGEIRSKEIV